MHRHQFTKLQTKITFQNRTGGEAISIATKGNLRPNSSPSDEERPKFRRILASPLDHGARKAAPEEELTEVLVVPLPRDPEFQRPPHAPSPSPNAGTAAGAAATARNTTTDSAPRIGRG